jgi:hypothetical protein
VEGGVDADEPDVLNDRLRDDQAVKRVFVVIGQRGQSGGVARLDREDVEPVVVDGAPEEVLIRQGQSILFHADLDRDLPLSTLAFDPDRWAILLLGGNKSGVSQKRFYKRLIARADALYDEHLKKIAARKKGKGK